MSAVEGTRPDDAALHAALARLLAPLARLTVAHGVPFAVLDEMLRQAVVAQAQGQLWQIARHGATADQQATPQTTPQTTPPTPTYVNPGLGEGPLGVEDAENFHS